MTIQREEQRQLLEEGVESYVPAVSAILAFRELVQSRWQRVLEQHLPKYGAALGLTLDKGQLLPYRNPPASKWDGQWASVGLRIRDVGDAKAWLSHSLYWELGEDGHWTTATGAAIWLRKRDQIDRLWKAFLPRPLNLCRDDVENEISLYEQVSRAEIADFDKKLDAVLGRWIKLLEASRWLEGACGKWHFLSV